MLTYLGASQEEPQHRVYAHLCQFRKFVVYQGFLKAHHCFAYTLCIQTLSFLFQEKGSRLIPPSSLHNAEGEPRPWWKINVVSNWGCPTGGLRAACGPCGARLGLKGPWSHISHFCLVGKGPEGGWALPVQQAQQRSKRATCAAHVVGLTGSTCCPHDGGRQIPGVRPHSIWPVWSPAQGPHDVGQPWSELSFNCMYLKQIQL